MKKITAVILAFVLSMSLLAGCGSSKVNADEVVATMTPVSSSGDAITVTYGEANFYSQYMQIYYDIMYSAFYGTGFWDITVDESGEATMADEMREQFLTEVEKMKVLNVHAAEYGISISEEEEAAIQEAAAKFIEDNDEDTLETLGATQEIVADYLRMVTIENKMQQVIYDEADITVSDEEALTRTFSYVTFSKTDEDESGNAIDYTANAQHFAEEAEAVESADAFDTLAQDHGYYASSYSYAADDTGMEEEVLAAADGLSEGETALVDTESAYYVICLTSEYDEAATEETRQSLISEKQSEYYEEVTDAYLAEYDIVVNEEVLEKVSFAQMYSMKETSDEDASADAEE